jgi:hypothetical protein
MKKLNACILLVLLSSFFNVTIAGPRVGNGGGAWVCERGGETLWIEVVDLFEAKNEFNLDLLDFGDKNFDDIMTFMKKRLDATHYYYYNNLDIHIAKVFESIQKVQSHELTPIDDVFPRVRPSLSHCPMGTISYEQVINFTVDGRVLIDEGFWKKLPASSKAALIFHEAFYSLFREIYRDEDSIRARKMVGLVFSNLSEDELSKMLKDEVFYFDSPHGNPLDIDILPFILTSNIVRDYISKSLDDYCVQALGGICDDNIYFKMTNISPKDGEVIYEDSDWIRILLPYEILYQLRGYDTYCSFNVDILEMRFNGQVNKHIHNLQFSCFEETKRD